MPATDAHLQHGVSKGDRRTLATVCLAEMVHRSGSNDVRVAPDLQAAENLQHAVRLHVVRMIYRACYACTAGCTKLHARMAGPPYRLQAHVQRLVLGID